MVLEWVVWFGGGKVLGGRHWTYPIMRRAEGEGVGVFVGPDDGMVDGVGGVDGVDGFEIRLVKMKLVNRACLGVGVGVREVDVHSRPLDRKYGKAEAERCCSSGEEKEANVNRTTSQCISASVHQSMQRTER